MINSYDNQFGYALRRQGGPAPWFQFFKQALFKLKNCESTQEFDDCKNFVLRVAGGWECSINDFPRTDVIKFIISRLTHPEDWVLCYHIMSLTRGCQATPRVEGEHGHSRKAGVNARCSWALTTIKYDKTLNRRRHRLVKWADKQISRGLARGVTNPAESTLTPEILNHLDSLMLPWGLDNLEVQMLCGRNSKLRCVYTEERGGKHIFAVFFEADEDDEDAPTAPEEANPATTPAVPGSPNDTSEDESEPDSEEDHDAGASTRKAALVEDADDENEWTEAMQEELEYALRHPIASDTTFFYKKVRKLTIMPDPKNRGKMLIICDCGYAPRIGEACRHVWCFIFTILKAIPRGIDGTSFAIRMCDCLTKPTPCVDCRSAEDYNAFSWDSHPLFTFEDMVNMDIVSKVKYHAALRPDVNANSLFPEEHPKAFHPRISLQLFNQFIQFHEPQGTSCVPTSGIPSDSHDHDDHDDDDDRGAAASSARNTKTPGARERGKRTVVPTFPMVNNLLSSMWSRTERLQDKKIKAEARAIILTHMQDANDKIMALHADLAPKRMKRFFNLRDRVLGLGNDNDD